MRAWRVVSIVVGVHLAAVVVLLLIQGCGSTPPRTSGTSGGPAMPPSPVKPAVAARQPAPPPPVRLPPARPWPAETTTYVVQKGESLSQIAGRYGLGVADLVALNKLADPSDIRAGQRLVLPGKHVVVAPSRPAPKPLAAPPEAVTAGVASEPVAPGGTYVVKAGDSLGAIATRQGTSVKALREANQLAGDVIRPGQKLTLPASGPAAAPGGSGAPVKPDVREAAPPPPAPPAPEPVPPPAVQASPPAAPGEPAAPPPVAVKAAPVYKTHVVEEGEDLVAVAMMWGVSSARIKEANQLASGAKLAAGQKLRIPISD